MITIRRYGEDDAPSVGRLIADTYGEFNLSFASPAERGLLLGPFQHACSPEKVHQEAIAQAIRSELVFVAEKEREIVGVLRGRTERLASLFVRGDHHRRGGRAPRAAHRAGHTGGPRGPRPGLAPFLRRIRGQATGGQHRLRPIQRFPAPVHERFPEALASLQDTCGLIVDLRGNHGGFFKARKALAEQLNGERVLFWSYKGREGIREVYLEPVKDAYTGPLVVLIDVMSLSSAEEFSGAMQAIDRAVIVGECSAGICVVADLMQLPNGATFMYPVEQTRTADGTVLEGRGVIPDIEVALDRALLLQGVDSQLEAAIQYILQKAKPGQGGKG